MARLNTSSLKYAVLALVLVCACVILLPRQLAAQQATQSAAQRQELAVSGSCARCHVSATLEWGISKHSTIAANGDKHTPNCVGCHGTSRDHVIDEQNTFKPDRVAHGDAIAALCVECHRRGCAQSSDLKNCQNCHHVHALVSPTLDAATIQKRANDLAGLMDASKKHLAEGERLVKLGQWDPARDAFTSALKENPGSDSARAALVMIARRLKPEVGGFKIVGDQFDPQSGLPKEIVMEGTGIGMVLVPAGSFNMGSDQWAQSRPIHSIHVAPFYMATCEMTQAQWKALMGFNPSYHQGDKFPQADKLPVEQVSWEDCQKMLVEVNKKVPGGGVRLPTEAEWEYAARAGSTGAFDPAHVLSSAWLRENSQIAGEAQARAAQDVEAAKLAAPDNYAPHPVGTAQSNPWGLYDMEGNVSQWCSSLALPYPYTSGDGRESADAPGLRVVRGANFADAVDSADPTLRHSDRPTRKLRWTGVRLAFSLAEPVIAWPSAVAPTTAPATRQ